MTSCDVLVDRLPRLAKQQVQSHSPVLGQCSSVQRDFWEDSMGKHKKKNRRKQTAHQQDGSGETQTPRISSRQASTQRCQSSVPSAQSQPQPAHFSSHPHETSVQSYSQVINECTSTKIQAQTTDVMSLRTSSRQASTQTSQSPVLFAESQQQPARFSSHPHETSGKRYSQETNECTSTKSQAQNTDVMSPRTSSRQVSTQTRQSLVLSAESQQQPARFSSHPHETSEQSYSQVTNECTSTKSEAQNTDVMSCPTPSCQPKSSSLLLSQSQTPSVHIQPGPTSGPSHSQVTDVHTLTNRQEQQSNEARNGPKEALKIPCLGRCFELGILYNCCNDKLFADIPLWNKEIIQKNTNLEKRENSRYEIITNDSFDKKAISLEMEPSIKLSFLSGLIAVEGSAKYLENNASSSRQARVVLKYCCNTFVENLLVGQIQLESIDCRDIVGKSLFTHVVTGVQYGFEAVFVFDRELSSEENCPAVESSLETIINQILKSHCEGHKIMINEDVEEEINQFQCTFHGDISLLKSPTTVNDAISVFKSLPKLLLKTANDKGVYGVPKIAYLQQLNDFGFDLPQQVQTINANIADEIQVTMQAFTELQLKATDLIRRNARFPGIKHQLRKFKESAYDFVKQMQLRLADVLPQVRVDKAEQIMLRDCIRNLKQTPFNLKKMAVWLESKNQEALLLTQSLHPLEPYEFMYEERELDPFLHDKNTKYVLILSFGIIASNSHPYLEEMSSYLNNPDDLSDSVEGFKEHWFHSDNIQSVFLRQMELFAQFASINKVNDQLKCFVMANSGCKAAIHSPGEIFLYIDGTRKSFQPPSPPGPVELITNAEYEVEIKWEAPQSGSKDVRQYCIAYKFDTKDTDWQTVVSESNETNCRITQLQPDTSYVFKVAAVCEAGKGAFNSPSLCFPTKPLPSLADRSLESCTLLSSASEGVPAWYLIPLKQTYHNDKMLLRKYEIGTASHEVISTKVMLIVGATGSGKTTLINGMINYLFGTKMDDDYRLKLIDEDLQESQAHSQTQYITAYTIHWQQGSKIMHNLTIVDTPGYGDTRGIAQDDHVTKQIKEFFEMEGSAAIDHLDAVGFVAQASAVRLTNTQKYVFDAILSIFGRDIADNIFMMLTFADSRPPPALHALKAHKLPYKSYFKFNNSVFTHQLPKTDYESNNPVHAHVIVNETFDGLFWKLAEESFSNFFSEFCYVDPKSLKLTKEVLQERQILECTIEGVQYRISSGVNHLIRMLQEVRVIEQFVAEKTANKDFTRTVMVPKTKRVHFTDANRCVTNCLNCNVTCHLHCMIRNDDQKYSCAAMYDPSDPTTTCRICSSHCDWRKHVNRDHYFEEYMERETVTIKDLKKKYDYADKSLSEKDSMLVGMYEQYNIVQKEVLEDMETVRKTLQRLDEIAMIRNPLTTVDYIDVLIKSIEYERKCGWKQKLDQLYNARRRALMIQKMEREGKSYDPFEEYQEEIQRMANMKCTNKQGVTKTIKAFFGCN